MTTDDFSWDAAPDGADLFADTGAMGDVPTHIDVSPDTGQEVVVLGDVQGTRDLNHPQGENPYGFQGTCGLVSCEDVLNQFGGHVTEAEVVDYAVSTGQCDVSGGDPANCGGTSLENQAQILTDGGVPATPVTDGSLDDLSNWVSQGHGVIVEVNAGELWNDAGSYDNGQANHAIVVTGVAVDPESGAVQGYYVNDSGRGLPEDSGRFVSADLMQQAWADTGGQAVVTDQVRA
jgi:hypothetical protein